MINVNYMEKNGLQNSFKWDKYQGMGDQYSDE